MARIRSIKPEFFTSRKIARLPVTARLTFIGLWTHVDDEGRAPDEPRLIKAALWPLDDKHTVAKVEEDLRVLAREGRILRYESDGERYLAVVGWGHQRIDKARESEYPSPPTPGTFQEPSANDPRTSDEPSGASRARADRIIGSDLGIGSDRSDSAAKPPPSRATGPPADFDIDDELRAWAATTTPSVDLERETARWLDYCRANGKKYLDWRAAWRTWMSRAVEYGQRPTNGRPTTAVERSWQNILEDDDDRRPRQAGARDHGHSLAPTRALEAGA